MYFGPEKPRQVGECHSVNSKNNDIYYSGTYLLIQAYAHRADVAKYARMSDDLLIVRSTEYSIILQGPTNLAR